MELQDQYFQQRIIQKKEHIINQDQIIQNFYLEDLENGIIYTTKPHSIDKDFFNETLEKTKQFLKQA